MKRILALALAFSVAACVLARTGRPASAFQYLVKVWSSHGQVYYLKTVHQPFMQEDLRWYKADGSTGTWAWSEIRSIEFLKNIGWWKGGKPDMEKGRMADVSTWSGKTERAYIWIDQVMGDDPWGPRQVDGENLTKIEFSERAAPPPPGSKQILVCPNGHTWENPGFRFCPYDKQKLSPQTRK